MNIDKFIDMTDKQASSQEREVEISEMKLMRFMEKTPVCEFFNVSREVYCSFFRKMKKPSVLKIIINKCCRTRRVIFLFLFFGVLCSN